MGYNICMVSDFFYPNIGGVESHIFQLTEHLVKNGHNVIVVTHAYNSRTGIRYITKKIKVYYLPMMPIYNEVIFPTIFQTLPLVRNILLRENIHIIHAHSAFSTLAHELNLHANVLGLKTVFTDHSLFGFSDASSIITNKILEYSLEKAHQIICVSYTSKLNTVMRSSVDPRKVSVIPNAVDSNIFKPDLSKRHPNNIVIVVVSRLVYRKGADLLVNIIPQICQKYSHVNFLIGGDGPKRVTLEEMRERNRLHNRVTLLGKLNSHQVVQVLNRGDIFLNTSLTEAFCIAIIEAVACGLDVVSTNVGGVPEILPKNMIQLANPSSAALIEKLEVAISDVCKKDIKKAWMKHEFVARTYTWQNVATRTEIVYQHAFDNNSINNCVERKQKSLFAIFVNTFFQLTTSFNKILISILSMFDNNIN